MGSRLALDPVADLRRRLAAGKPPRLRACVERWWRDHELGDHPAAVGKRIALALIEQPGPDAKRAGIMVLHDRLGEQLRAADLPAFARLFARGHLAGEAADAFGAHVLAAMLARLPARADTARAVAQWAVADGVWQRRAACLGFAAAAERDAVVVEPALALCGSVVWSIERGDQLAVGGLLRALARIDPGRVEAFFRRHAMLMSVDGARVALAAFPAAKRAELLAHHRRATTLR